MHSADHLFTVPPQVGGLLPIRIKLSLHPTALNRVNPREKRATLKSPVR